MRTCEGARGIYGKVGRGDEGGFGERRPYAELPGWRERIGRAGGGGKIDGGRGAEREDGEGGGVRDLGRARGYGCEE